MRLFLLVLIFLLVCIFERLFSFKIIYLSVTCAGLSKHHAWLVRRFTLGVDEAALGHGLACVPRHTDIHCESSYTVYGYPQWITGHTPLPVRCGADATPLRITCVLQGVGEGTGTPLPVRMHTVYVRRKVRYREGCAQGCSSHLPLLYATRTFPNATFGST